MNVSSLVVIQAVAPDYRIGLFNTLFQHKGVQLICGDEYFSSVKSDPAVFENTYVQKSTNLYFLKRKGLWQVWPGYFVTLLGQNVRVVELNPRCVTSWLSLLCSRLLKRGKTVVWGHLLNRAGEQKRWSARQLMLKLANGALFYTRGQMDAFKATPAGQLTISGYAPNSVVYASQVTHFTSAGQDFLYVGRLVADKKPMLLLDAFLLACAQGLESSLLHIVGAGSEAAQLQARLATSPYRARVVLHGHNNDYVFLHGLYQRSVCSVSPGYVGLSVTQSLSFGRPMLIAEHEPHAPEIEAFIPGENGRFFRSDDAEDLSRHLLAFYLERDYWAAKSAALSAVVLEKYTYEAMAAGYLSLIDEVRQHG
jgi:glycosyltransferase involved in cell wall biosynthesis